MKANPSNKKYDYLLENNQGYMDYVALTFGKRKITYEELHDRIDKYSKLLYQKGVRQGDLIGLCAMNTPESVYLLYALNKIGAIVVGYNPFESKENTRADIEMTRPKMIITVDMNYSNFKDYEKALNFSPILYSPLMSADDIRLKVGYGLMQLKNGNFVLSRNNKLGSLLRKDLSDVVVEDSEFMPGTVSDILFTGGSTGVHKGVDLSDDGLNYVVEGMNELFPAKPGLIHLGNIPFGHMAYGRSLLHFTLCNNMEYALTLKAMPSDFYDELVRTQAYAAVGGPPHWTSLIQRVGDELVPNRKLKRGALSSLKYATSGGEAKKKSTVKAINDALHYCGSDAILGDGLGATETWASMFINNGRIHHNDTVGKPLSTINVKLLDPETGEEVKKGESGILYVSGPTVMLGYHNNEEETEKVTSYDTDGERWINIDDILCEDEYGEYHYLGRRKRNFVSAVDNIYPESLEDVLGTIPEIREILVTPISDEMVQYIPRYHITLSNPDVDLKELEDKIYAVVLSSFNENWLPGSIVYYNEPLKRMSNSKIDISYYKKIDEEDMLKGKINNDEGRQLRLNKM